MRRYTQLQEELHEKLFTYHKYRRETARSKKAVSQQIVAYEKEKQEKRQQEKEQRLARNRRGQLPLWGALLPNSRPLSPVAPLPPIPNTGPFGSLATGTDTVGIGGFSGEQSAIPSTSIRAEMVPFPFPSWDLDDLDDLEANLESASAVGGVSSSMPSARFVRSNLTSARQTYSEQLQPLPFRLPPLDLELMNSPIKEASREFSVGDVSNHTFTHNTIDHTMERLFEHQQPQHEKQQQENEEEQKEQREEENGNVTQQEQENAKDYANEDEKASKSEVSDEKTIILPPMTLPPLARPGLVTAPREPIIVKLKRAARKARAEQKEDEPPSIFRALRAALAKRENNDDVQFLSGLVVRRKEVKTFLFYSIYFLF